MCLAPLADPDLYEVVPVGVTVSTSDVDPLKYQRERDQRAPQRLASC